MRIQVRALLRGLAAAGALAAAAACGDDDVDIVDPPIQGGELFRSYVSLGNSITAGYQSSGINDSTQRESYAHLFAGQLYGADAATRFRYPSVGAPGCRPPLTSLTVAQPATCSLRAPASFTATLNNVAVPGSTVADLTRATATDTTNLLFNLFLGGRPQVSRAVQARPTFATLWIGNNDVLAAAVSGVLTPTAGVSPGVTTQANFVASYDAATDSLQTAGTLQGGALFGVVDVTSAPILFPAQALLNPAFKAGFDQYVGKATTVLPNCTNSTSLVSFQIVSFLRGRPAAEPAVIGCARGSVPGSPTVGDLFILDAAEQTTVRAAVAAYNAYIQAKADSLNFAYVDPNPLLAQLRAGGQIPTVPNLANPARPFGTHVSLDGVHPARPAHVVVANALIAAVNTKYAVSIPTITP